jgi:hypothetical protein
MLARDTGEQMITRRLPLGMAQRGEGDVPWDDAIPLFEK